MTAENHAGRDWLHTAGNSTSGLKQLQQGRRHTAMVKTLKTVLVLAAALLCALLVYNLTASEDDRSLAVSGVGGAVQQSQTADTPAQPPARGTPEPLAAVSAQSEIAMIGARYGGMDNKGRPFTITADSASRSPDMPDIINLQKPMADILLADSGWIAVESLRGVYMQDHMQLFLHENVRFFHDTGYEMHTGDLHIDLKTSMVRGTTPVSGHGPAGAVEAGGMVFDPSEDKIIFNGPARLTLFLPTKDIFLEP